MQRRLTTIVAADVAGYSRLIGLDEEGTLAALLGHRQDLIDPLLEQHGGRVANTAGDSLLIEFPSAVEAVRCAMAVQGGMAERNADVPDEYRVEFRVGVNVGDVVDQDGDLLGDGVNIAARLEAQALPGGIVLSRSVRDQVRDKMDLNLADLGEVEVKNIARPVRAFQVMIDRGVPVGVTGSGRRSRSTVVVSVSLATLVVIVGAYVFNVWPFASLTESAALGRIPENKPSIAVLPFENLSRDVEQVYFSDGVAEDIITELSRSRDLVVVSKSASFKFREHGGDLRQVSEKLGAQYMVTGSIRKNAENLRLTARLLDASTERQIWGNRYDVSAQDLFIVQEDVLRNIVSNLLSQVHASEMSAAFRKPTENLDAYDYVKRGIRRIETASRESLELARIDFEKAIELDPNYAVAHANLGRAVGIAVARGYSSSDSLELALKSLQRAISIEPELIEAYRYSALVLTYKGDTEAAVRAGIKAVELNSNNPDNYAFLAIAQRAHGQYGDSAESMKKAIQLNPNHPTWYLGTLGITYFAIGDYESAREVLSSCLSRQRDYSLCNIWMSATLAQLEEVESARAYSKRVYELLPGYSIAKAEETYSYLNHERALERLLDALRTAGIKDQH